MASHLMQIKTKMLLSVTEREEALSEMEQLRRSLEERQRASAFEQIQLAAKFLEQRNEIGINLFTKQPEPLKKDKTYRYKHVPEDLLKALDAITERSAKMLPPPTVNFKGIVGKEPYPVGKKAAQVLRRLVQHGILRLKNLFRGNRSRSEIVATFLAVLELCKTNSVSLEDDVNGDNPNVRLLETPERKEEPDGI
jgi:segregation and condensation protein A